MKIIEETVQGRSMLSVPFIQGLAQKLNYMSVSTQLYTFGFTPLTNAKAKINQILAHLLDDFTYLGRDTSSNGESSLDQCSVTPVIKRKAKSRESELFHHSAQIKNKENKICQDPVGSKTGIIIRVKNSEIVDNDDNGDHNSNSQSLCSSNKDGTIVEDTNPGMHVNTSFNENNVRHPRESNFTTPQTISGKACESDLYDDQVKTTMKKNKKRKRPKVKKPDETNISKNTSHNKDQTSFEKAIKNIECNPRCLLIGILYMVKIY